MKKGFFVMLALTVFLALGVGFSDSADAAKRGGGFKSNKQSYTQKKDSNTQQSNSGATSGTTTNKNSSTTGTGTTATTKSGGLFGGSSFLKGMALGGLAGLLFGGMFGSMGAFGEILGFLVNVMAIVAILMIIAAAFKYLRNSKKPAASGYNYNRNNRFDRDDEDRNGRG